MGRRLTELAGSHAVVVLLLCATGSTWASDASFLAFKSCATLSSIQRCKVKSVEVTGCENESVTVPYDYPQPSDNNIEDLLRDRNFCKVSKKSQLNFTITVDTGFSSSKLSSQFTGAGGPEVDCSPEAQAPQCPPWRPGCPPARVQHTPGHCLFREFIRDGCRGTRCPLSPRGIHKVTDHIKINPDSDITSIDKRNFKMQWRLWNSLNKKDNCCFTFWLKYY